MKRQAAGAPAAAPDEALVGGLRSGEPGAVDRFYRAHVARVERVIARLLGPTPDLEDLVQTTFVEAIRGAARFRGEASLATWVTRIAVHVVGHQLRRGGVRRAVSLELVTVDAEPRDPRPPPDAQVDDHRLADRMHRLLDQIGVKKRIAFLLYTVEGHSIEEVAALMDAGRAATKSRIWFARRELRALADGDAVLCELAARAGGES